MDVAFLFAADRIGGFYVAPVLEAILGTGAFQSAQRQMRISIGDVLTFSAASQSADPTYEGHRELCRRVYRSDGYDTLERDVMEATYNDGTVFCWVIQNADKTFAARLDGALDRSAGYLGALEVNFGNPLHLVLFRTYLPEAYRVVGRSWSIFYHVENEDPEVWVKEALEGAGFTVVFEDMGARRTVFDDYDTPDHFKRVADFKEIVTPLMRPEVTDVVSDVVLGIEEIHPGLFDALAAVVRALQRAETPEDIAQAAFSGRRFLEALADCLFPPSDEVRGTHALTTPKHRNRIWAYLEDTLNSVGGASPAGTLADLGKRTDTLFDLFNAGLHASPTRSKVEGAIRDLVTWLRDVIGVSPEAARRPYLAYSENVMKMLNEVVRDHDLGNDAGNIPGP